MCWVSTEVNFFKEVIASQLVAGFEVKSSKILSEVRHYSLPDFYSISTLCNTVVIQTSSKGS